MKAVGDCVIVRPEIVTQVGNIYLPAGAIAEKGSLRGEVVCAPAEIYRGGLVPTDLAAGDRVIIPMLGGQLVNVEGETLRALRVGEILAKEVQE